MEILGVAAIVGLINGAKLYEKDKVAFFYFVGSLGLGVFFGYFGYFGISGIETGLLYGLSASGFYKGLQVAGGK